MPAYTYDALDAAAKAQTGALEAMVQVREGLPPDLRSDPGTPAIEQLVVAETRQVLQVIDAFIERGQFKRKAESRA